MFNFESTNFIGFQTRKPPLQGGPGVDPEVHAQNYANEKGITLEEAKAELKAKFGEPKAPGSIFGEGPQKPGDYDPIGQRSKPDGSQNNTQDSSKSISQILKLIINLISLILGKGPQNPGDYDPIGQKSKPDGTLNV